MATATPTVFHLSLVVGGALRDAAGERLGRVDDLIVRLGDEDYPPVTGVVATVAGRQVFVAAEQIVELAGVQAADGLVVDREVEDGEEVAADAALVAGVEVDLRPLAAGENVLDVERVPAEAACELLRLLRRRREEVDPGDSVARELGDARPRVDDRSSGRSAARTDARQVGHRY